MERYEPGLICHPSLTEGISNALGNLQRPYPRMGDLWRKYWIWEATSIQFLPLPIRSYKKLRWGHGSTSVGRLLAYSVCEHWDYLTKWKGVGQKSWQPRHSDTESHKGDLLTKCQKGKTTQACVGLSPRGDSAGRDTQNNRHFFSTERDKQVVFQAQVHAFIHHLYRYYSTIS